MPTTPDPPRPLHAAHRHLLARASRVTQAMFDQDMPRMIASWDKLADAWRNFDTILQQHPLWHTPPD